MGRAFVVILTLLGYAVALRLPESIFSLAIQYLHGVLRPCPPARHDRPLLSGTLTVVRRRRALAGGLE